MTKYTTLRFPAADLVAAKDAVVAFHADLAKKAVTQIAVVNDPHVVFVVGKVTAGPKKELVGYFANDPVSYLLIDPPGGITYAELLDFFFGATRAERTTELMGMTLVMLSMIRRVGLTQGRDLIAMTEENFLGPLLKMAMEYSNEKVPQKIVSVYATHAKR